MQVKHTHAHTHAHRHARTHAHTRRVWTPSGGLVLGRQAGQEDEGTSSPRDLQEPERFNSRCPSSTWH